MPTALDKLREFRRVKAAEAFKKAARKPKKPAPASTIAPKKSTPRPSTPKKIKKKSSVPRTREIKVTRDKKGNYVFKN